MPEPRELASRIEEARTSAKLLTQLTQSTPPSELLQNDLIREFSDRCQSASRSIQAYMVAENPAPDNDTMLTLIETNDQLALAMSKHQRAVLQARKTLGLGSESGGVSPALSAQGDAGFVPPPGPPPATTKPAFPSRNQTPSPAPPAREPVASSALGGPSPPIPEKPEDPFRDPAVNTAVTTTHNPPFPQDKKPPPADQYQERLGLEPYHPGFNPTQSYMGRQDSAVGKVTMTAAIPSPPLAELEGEGHRSNVEDDEYGVSPERKAPIYRY